MRALNIICGIAVLILSLHMVHAIHHFVSHSPEDFHGAGFVALLVAGIAVDILAFIGGCLLIIRRR
jgi:hypothetical protein